MVWGKVVSPSLSRCSLMFLVMSSLRVESLRTLGTFLIALLVRSHWSWSPYVSSCGVTGIVLRG
jgi:hypothetical protein